MMQAMDFLAQASFWAAMIAAATPLAFGVLGGLFCARAGVLNLGIEGVFIAGALAGATAVQLGGGPWEGVIAAVIVGMALGFLLTMLIGPIGVPQPLAGLAVTLLAASAAPFAVRALLAAPSGMVRSAPFALVAPPLPAEVSAAVVTLLQQTPLTYLAILLAFVVAYVLNRTPLGLALRACGDNPAAVAAQGRSVDALRCGAIIAGSAMAATGGACLTLAGPHAFALDLLAGRGILCLALAAAAGWRPSVAIAAVLPFGAIEATRPHLLQLGGDRIAPELLTVAQLLLAIVAVAIAGRRVRYSQRP
jgi:general nucleoside transport system permease protein